MLVSSLPLATRLKILKTSSIATFAHRAASIKSAIRKGSRRSALAGERRRGPSRERSRPPQRQDERRKAQSEYSGARSYAREGRIPATSERLDGRTSQYDRLPRREDRVSVIPRLFKEKASQHDHLYHQRSRGNSNYSAPSNAEYERRTTKFQEALRSTPGQRSGPSHTEIHRARRRLTRDEVTEVPIRQGSGDAHGWGRFHEKRGRRDYEEEHSRIDYEDEIPDIRPITRRQLDPISIPYTTPASEFLYGTSVVRAALTARRRRLYKLYIYTGENRVNLAQDRELRRLAESMGVDVRQVRGDFLRVMDKMSRGRPHNGYILEASPLPQLPIRSLNSIDDKVSAFGLDIDHQSREEEEINGGLSTIRCQTKSRNPVILLIDGILDPGNLGGILRTAYFFGIDAVAIAKGNNAPIGPVAQKASSGAIENLQMLSISDPGRFVERSQENGWRFYAAVAPSNRVKRQHYLSSRALAMPAKDGPCCLMIGGEGEGLRSFLQAKADSLVGIEGDRLGRGGVDSLNVSVAAGILCDAFSQSPERLVKDSYKERHAGLPAVEAEGGGGELEARLLF